jgi:hypothetical protein
MDGLPCTIRASLWYLLKLSSFLLGLLGDARCDGLPSRQNVKSVRYSPVTEIKSGSVPNILTNPILKGETLLTQERYSRRCRVPQPSPVLVIVPRVIRKLTQAFEDRLVLLWKQAPRVV